MRVIIEKHYKLLQNNKGALKCFLSSLFHLCCVLVNRSCILLEQESDYKVNKVEGTLTTVASFLVQFYQHIYIGGVSQG